MANTMYRFWEIRNCFDVWGNEKDGWEVNDSTVEGIVPILECDIDNDKVILDMMVRLQLLSTNDRRKIEISGECGVIEILEKKTRKPLYWLTCVDFEDSKGRKVR